MEVKQCRRGAGFLVEAEILSLSSPRSLSPLILQVAPAHIVFVLPKEEGRGAPLFPSVILRRLEVALYVFTISRMQDAELMMFLLGGNEMHSEDPHSTTDAEPGPETSPSSVFFKVLQEAQSIHKTMDDSYIVQGHLLLALWKDFSIAPVIREAGLTEATLKTVVQQISDNCQVESKNAEGGFDALRKYAIGLTTLAEGTSANFIMYKHYIVLFV
ncbi:uncharacterized protein ARMOST_18548 [Armillaria ostoyae]|uniref:Clp R domain-containing protein n=1 Tax=Armillaria ostoyae TaxID=47428 RepID=A0A284S253_ARMOS|nr:uncharacterized protein ARMOST_18548 [Armillaria ostoyae]